MRKKRDPVHEALALINSSKMRRRRKTAAAGRDKLAAQWREIDREEGMAKSMFSSAKKIFYETLRKSFRSCNNDRLRELTLDWEIETRVVSEVRHELDIEMRYLAVFDGVEIRRRFKPEDREDIEIEASRLSNLLLEW